MGSIQTQSEIPFSQSMIKTPL